jgi:dsDNA-binding SOS-regulon protein
MSALGWIDFSSDDRTRVQEVLALLKEPGTLDELGIGQVRDAFSDVLFPGFSTIQTKARYFLAVPKILLDWAEQPPAKRRKQPLATYLREAENELARTLRANYLADGLQPEGVIGHTVVDNGGVARRPSSTYWNGLRVFNIVATSKSLAEFCRDWKQESDEFVSVDAEEGNDDVDHHFESEVRRPPESKGPWREGLTLALSKREADFLSERFRTAKGLQNSVAAQLLSTDLAESAIAQEHERFAALSVWASHQTNLNSICRARIASAQRFSDAVEGAHIIFNRLLAEKLEDAELKARCVDEYDRWKARVTQAHVFHSTAPQEWLEASFTVGAAVNQRTSSFLHDWNDAMCRAVSQKKLDALVQAQAVKNKPGRSLLVRLPRTKSNWYGMKELDYRWSTARRMLRDVTEGQRC